MDADLQRTLKLVNEACDALEALLDDWVVMAATDDEVPPEVITWLRAQRDKFAARNRIARCP